MSGAPGGDVSSGKMLPTPHRRGVPQSEVARASMTQEWTPLWTAVLPNAEQPWQEVLRLAPGGAFYEPLNSQCFVLSALRP